MQPYPIDNRRGASLRKQCRGGRFYSPVDLHMRTWLWHCTRGWRLARVLLGTEVVERPGARVAAGGEGGGEGDGELGPHWVW